jgi:hypothetical protein
MSRTRFLIALTAGTTLAALLATAARRADAAGEEAGPERTEQEEKPAAAARPAAVASPPTAAPAPAAWSPPPKGGHVSAGVLARAARRAQERETATAPAAERPRAGKARGGGTIVSIEIDWNAARPAP